MSIDDKLKEHECPYAKKLKSDNYSYRCSNEDYCDYKERETARIISCNIQMVYNMTNKIGDYIELGDFSFTKLRKYTK